MKVLKALLAIFTFLAAALTCTLLFVQDKNAPHYITIYENERSACLFLVNNRRPRRTVFSPPSGAFCFFELSFCTGILYRTSNRQTA